VASSIALHEASRELEAASQIDWGVFVDAYLTDAARVGERYAACAHRDRSGVICDGMTIVTPPVVVLAEVGTFSLLRSLSGQDHYVIVTRHPGSGA
jgi:hypothetical protein